MGRKYLILRIKYEFTFLGQEVQEAEHDFTKTKDAANRNEVSSLILFTSEKNVSRQDIKLERESLLAGPLAAAPAASDPAQLLHAADPVPVLHVQAAQAEGRVRHFLIVEESQAKKRPTLAATRTSLRASGEPSRPSSRASTRARI